MLCWSKSEIPSISWFVFKLIHTDFIVIFFFCSRLYPSKSWSNCSQINWKVRWRTHWPLAIYHRSKSALAWPSRETICFLQGYRNEHDLCCSWQVRRPHMISFSSLIHCSTHESLMSRFVRVLDFNWIWEDSPPHGVDSPEGARLLFVPRYRTEPASCRARRRVSVDLHLH